MAEAALCIAWGDAVKGRGKHALEVYAESMQYWERLQKEGQIERYDVTVLAPTGGDVGGFWLVRGTAAQIDSLRRSDEFLRLINRVQLLVTGLRVTDAYVDEGIAKVMSSYQDAVGELD
jgi:hypothetical protein